MKYLIGFILCALNPFLLRAQQNMTLYQIHDIVQSNMLNPAIPADCRWVVGLPALGSVSLAFSGAMSYNELGAGQKVLNPDALIAKLKPSNAIMASGTVNLLLIGHRTESTYWQFTVNERLSALGVIPKEPVEVILKGNAPYAGRDMRGNFAANAVYYREYALSISHNFSDYFWAGIRPKLLFGRMGLSGQDNSLELYTDPTTYELSMNTNLNFRTSVPGKAVIDSTRGTVKSFKTNIQTQDFIFSPSNLGFGLDFGVSQLMDNDIKVSASLLNVGIINWGKNTHNFSQKQSINYTGPSKSMGSWTEVVDTFKNVLRYKYSDSKFSQWLSPVLMFGLSYPIVENIRVGVTGMTEFQSGYTPWAVTASVFTEGSSLITAGLSYTLSPNSMVNIGLASALHLGPVDIHFTTDNFIGVLSPFDYRYATLQFGINFKFECGTFVPKKNRDVIPCAAYRSVNTSKRKCVPCSKGK